MTRWLRSFGYGLVFYTLSVLIVITVPVAALWGPRGVIAHAHVWAGMQRWSARVIMGIDVKVEGTAPAGPVLFAAKHQAMFETLELQVVLGGPAMVLKRQLMRIPLWGWAARLYGGIPVDRDASASALRGMVRAAAAITATGRSVILYPEGTRVAPGEQPPLKSGFAGLYRTLGMTVVPVAVNSGLVLPRHGPRRSGTITIRIGAPIPPGLPRREAEARVHAAINALEG